MFKLQAPPLLCEECESLCNEFGPDQLAALIQISRSENAPAPELATSNLQYISPSLVELSARSYRRMNAEKEGHFVPGDQGHKIGKLKLCPLRAVAAPACRATRVCARAPDHAAPALLRFCSRNWCFPRPLRRAHRMSQGKWQTQNDEEHYNTLRDDTNHHTRTASIVRSPNVGARRPRHFVPGAHLQVPVIRSRSRNVGMYAAQARARDGLLKKETTQRRRIVGEPP